MNKYFSPLLTSIALLLLLPMVAYPAIVGADDPKAFTERQYREQTEAFNRRTILLAYQKIGKHDPKWDNLITPFLEGVCRYMAWTDAFSPYRVPDVPTAEALEKIGRPIYQAGCDDPMFLDMYSLVMIATPRWADALPIMKTASEQLPTSKYGPFRAANSVRRYYRVTHTVYDSPAGLAFDDKLVDLDLATFESKGFEGIEQRIVYDPILEDFQRWTLARRTQFIESLEKSAAADPWLKSLLLGVNSINVGWAARGEGWANTVTLEGWATLADELDKARAYLVRAHNLHPDWPEAATEMISVVMGESNPPAGDSLRGWFDRATRAQIDYRNAYKRYRYAMLPRWHGDHATIQSFALECAATGRYDTSVPLEMISGMLEIEEDLEGDWSVFNSPVVKSTLKEMLNRSANAAVAGDRGYYYALLLGLAWQIRDYDLARGALDKLNGDYAYTNAFQLAQVIPSRAIAGTYALTGPYKNTWLEGEKKLANNDFEGALDSYTSVHKTLKSDDQSYAWANERVQEIIWLNQFNTGQPVDLIPVGREMLGWYILAGKPRVGTTRAIDIDAQAGGGAVMICGPVFGQRWELSGTARFLTAGSTNVAPEVGAGLTYGWAGSDSHYGGVYLLRGTNHMRFHYDGTYEQNFAYRVSSPSIIKIRYWDGKAEMLINDKLVKTYSPLPKPLRPDSRIGLAATSGPNTSIRFQDLKIRKLDKEPVAATTQP